jgi:O-antigen/teichoic acid export membrane protein
MMRGVASLRKLGGDGLQGQILRGGVGSLVVRVANLGLEMCVAIALARLMGVEGYGVYAYAYALMRTLAIPAQAGLPTLAVREVAAYTATSEWSLLRGLLRRMNQVALLFSLGIAALGASVALFWRGPGSPMQLATFAWALLLLPLMALGNIRGAILRGLHLVVQGQLPENVLRPAFFLLLIGVFLLAKDTFVLTPQTGMALHAGGAAIAFAIGAWLLLRNLPRQVSDATPAYDTRRWVLSAIPLSMIMGMMVINNQAAILILGMFAPARDVGVYGAVSQVALVVTVPLTVVNLTVGPHISRLYAEGDRGGMQRVAALSAWAILVAGVSLAAVLAIGGKWILGLAFGPEFARGYVALAILCVGQGASALLGASMIVLNMTRNEKQVAVAFAVAVGSNIALNFLATPRLGLVGAATAVAASLILLNGLLAWQVHRKVGINPLPSLAGKRAVVAGYLHGID